MNLASNLHDVIKRHETAVVIVIALIAVVYYLALLPGIPFGEPFDDAHYAMLVRNLATGKGFFDTSLPQEPIDTFVPPGYPALLTPIAVLFPDQILPLQLVSLVFAVGSIFLTHRYLRLNKFSPTFAILIVTFVAFNPVMAKYATILMPETMFIFCFLLLLIALHHYERSSQPMSRSAIASILALAALFYLKTASAGLLAGVILYIVAIRKFRHAAVLTVGVGVLVGILFLSRIAIGDPLIGYGYQANISDYYLIDPTPVPIRMLNTIKNGLWLYISFAVSVTLMPPAFYVGALSRSFYPTFDALYSWTIVPLVAIGWYVYTRRYRDASVVAIPLYLASALVLPYINERRIILVLPLVVTYWLLGMKTLASEILPMIFRRRRYIASGAFMIMIGTLCILLGVYIYTRLYTIYVRPIPKLDMNPQATWINFLAEVPDSEDVIEGDNPYLLHYLTGHKSLAQVRQVCKLNNLDPFWQKLSDVSPRFMLVTGMTVSPARYSTNVQNCVLPALQQNPHNFVRVYSQPKDLIQIYEVINATRDAGTRENLIDGMPLYTNNDRAIMLNATSSTEPSILVSFASEQVTQVVVPFSQPSRVDTIVIGQASANIGVIAQLDINLQQMNGTWQQVDTLSNMQIGYASTDAAGKSNIKPYYYLKLPESVTAKAIQIVLQGADWFILRDLAVLGTPLEDIGSRPDLSGYTPVSQTPTAWQAVIGTWDGEQSSIGLFDGKSFFLPNEGSLALTLNAVLQPMLRTDVPMPVVGRWSENQSKNQLGVYYNGHFYLQDKDRVRVIAFGGIGDRPVVGDWDGDGITTVGVYRGGTFSLTNNPDGGATEIELTLRRPDEADPDDLIATPLAGDWDGDGKDTPGLFVLDVFFLWDSLRIGNADRLVRFGIPGDVPLIGDWDGDGTTNIGISRNTQLVLADEWGVPLVNQPKIAISKIVAAPLPLAPQPW